MKKILFISLIFFITFIIYYLNINHKVYYLSLGDYLSYGINNENKVDNNYSDNIKNKYKDNLQNYINYSSIDDYRVMDLINDIKYNKVVKFNNKEYKLQNLLIKSNLITLSIGMNDLIYAKNLNYTYADNLLDDLERLFIVIRKYNKDKIYFLGFYNIINNNDLIEYKKKKIRDLCKENNIKYVDISKLNEFIKYNDNYPNNDGYFYITERINFTNR